MLRNVMSLSVVVAGLVLLQLTSAAAASTSGSLDRTFAGNGIAYVAQTAYAVALQADRKIVVAGGGITRYNRDGTLDRSFSGDGQAPTPFHGRFGAVAIQPNGRIVAGGIAEVRNRDEFAFARYLPDGSLDRSFSGNGTLVARKVGSMAVEEISDIALGPNNTIVASAYVIQRHYLFGVVRLTRRGVPDTTFSGDGVAITRFNRHSAFAESVAVQRDGAIIAAGSARARARFAVSRYLPDGTHDPSFSGDGKRTIAFGGTWSRATAVGLQDDGRIVIAGTVRHGPRQLDYGHLSIAVARCKPDGSLDASFAGDGTRWTSADGNLRANALAIQSDGKILVGGESTPTVDEFPDDFALVRYTTTGNLDTSFAGDGVKVQSFRSGDWIEGMALQANGKIVVVGSTQGGAPRGYAVARFLP
ncbi:MAG: hypothetical protein ACJ76A_07340 [Actinomycetota bacterium]